MGHSSPGRPPVGRKYEVRLGDRLADAVADYAETRWPANKHAAGIARRDLIAQAIYAYQTENKIMSVINIAVLDQPTSAAGIEWGLALDDAPAIATPEVEAFLREHGAWDNSGTDTYVLVVPDELWDTELTKVNVPFMEVEVPAVQSAALTDTINAYQ